MTSVVVMFPCFSAAVISIRKTCIHARLDGLHRFNKAGGFFCRAFSEAGVPNMEATSNFYSVLIR